MGIKGAAMGTPSPCPYCSAPRRAGGGGRHDAVADALQDLNRQVALIRKMAEESSRQEREILLLRETIARLRGSPVAVARPRAAARDSSAA